MPRKTICAIRQKKEMLEVLLMEPDVFLWPSMAKRMVLVCKTFKTTHRNSTRETVRQLLSWAWGYKQGIWYADEQKPKTEPSKRSIEYARAQNKKK